MSDVKYVLADDGELYPVPEEISALPAWLNLDTVEAEDDVLPQIKVSLEKPKQYVNIPKVEEPEAEEWRIKIPFIKKAMIAFVDRFDIVGILTVLMFFPTAASKIINGEVSFPLIILTLLPMVTYLINLILLCIPKKYLPKGTQVWVVNYREERVETATVLKNTSKNARFPGEYFNENLFTLDNENSTFDAYGRNIFLSEDTAMQMLAYLQNYNDRMISEYYPEWKNDKNFIRYYKKREGDRYSKQDAVIAIGGDGKHFVREYINEMHKKHQQRKQDREEKAAMMKEIQQYKD